MRDLGKRRKNFLPTLIIDLVSWFGWIWIFLKIPPGSWFSFLIFYLAFFLAIFLALALIFGQSRRATLITIGITSFLILKQLKLASFLNLLLLFSFLASLEFYFSRPNKKD